MAIGIGHTSKRTHRKKPRRAPQEDALRIREVLVSALDCVIVMDHEGKITEFNTAAEKTFGYSRAEVIGKELAELLVPPSQREAHRRALAHYRATREGPLLDKRIELTARRADNSEFPVELTVTRVGSQWPPYFVGFVRDITERKRAEEQIQLQRQRATILHEINVAATSSLDPRTVLDFLLEKINLFLPYSVTAVRLLNRKTGRLERVRCTNLNEEEWEASKQNSGRGLANTVFKTGSPLMIANAPLDPRTMDPEFLRKHGVVSYLGLPLRMRGEILGVISFFTKEEHAFSDEEIEFLSALAREAAIAIHNSQLYEKTKEQAITLEKSNQRTAALHEINLAISSSLDLQTVLKLLLEKIDLLLPYSVATVRLLNRETGILEPTACRNLDEKEWKKGRGTGGIGLTRLVLESRAPVFIANARLDPRTKNRERIVKYGLCSYLGFPLIIKGEILGVISFYTKEERHFSGEEIEFLTTLAGQAAIAIHNSQLYEQAEKQRISLQKSEERFRIIARATNDVVWDWDLLTNEVGVNEGVRTLFGYDAEKIHNVTWWYENICPDDRERVIAGIHALIDSGEKFWSDEYRFSRADGSFAYVFDRGNVMRDENDKPVRMIGAMMDITERKQAGQRLADSENRLRTILDSEPEGVNVLTSDGRLLEMNPAGLAMIEADSPDEVIGKPVLPLIVPEHRQLFQTLMETISRGESDIFKFQIVGLKGTRRWLESHAVPLRDPEGQIIASLSITRDVTEHKRLEKEILEISEKEQRRLGQDLHDGLGQHLAGVACLMKGLEQKLAMKSEKADATLLTSLVNEAIAQTRNLARGLYPVELEANGLMAALEELACNTAKIFNISCLFQCHEPVLVHDNTVATHLYRIAQGAVDNAIKHSRAKQVLISLSRSDGKIVLSVSDDGIGIEETPGSNKGMGLQIMRHRVEMIRASLDIRRGEPGGTVVTCSL